MNKVIQDLSDYLIGKNKEEFSNLFSENSHILGYEPGEFYNFLRRNMIFSPHQEAKSYTEVISLGYNSVLARIFINEILILEEVFTFEPLTKKILGTDHKIDCFGKLAIFNDRFERLLTIRPKRGDELKNVIFPTLNIKDSVSINKGTLFDDGYYSGHFSLYDDDYKTKIVDVKLLTNKGFENQKIVLRSIDYPFFHLHQPIIKENTIILTEETPKIYKLLVTFKDGSQQELEQSDIYKLIGNKHLLIFNKEISEVYQSINGCAMNYFTTN